MLDYDWQFGRLAPFIGALADGVFITLLLSLATIGFALVVGVTWGVGLARNRAVKLVTLPMADILKCLPPLVLVLFGYFFLSPGLIGFKSSEFLTFVIFVGLNVAAFVADLVRAAITNVPRDYLQLGAALALSERQILWRVIAPIALRELIPPLAYLAIETIKLTSLASIINVREMVYVAQGAIVTTSRSLEV